MNAQRRKSIAKAMDLLERAREILETVGEEEQEAYDNLPEAFQDGERGEKMSEAIDALDDAQSEIGDMIDNLQEVIDA